MTREKLNEMKKAAGVLTGEERIKALFAYHEEEVNYWDSCPGFTDYDVCEKNWKKACKLRDSYFNMMRGGSMNKAACYLRVSTEEQARGGVSLPDQEERTKAYCKMMGYEPVAVIREEGVSAGKKLSERPGGKELISLVSTKQINHVVTMKLDRLFRSAVNALCQSEEWDKANVALHFVDMGGQTINTSSAMGKMFFTMSAAFAELERNLIRERTCGAMSYKKAHREAYCPTPFGFTREGKALVTNKEELDRVARINTLRSQGMSFGRIAKTFNTEGIPSKNGGKWHASTVHYIVKNSLYKEDVA